MKTFDKSEPIPAAAITLATGNSNIQPILFTTQQFCEDVNGKRVKNDWVISHIECTVLRDWSTSTFQVILKCDLPNSLSPVPKLPDVSKWRGGKYPYLDREDEIRIYMGYIASLETVIGPNLLDELPFDVPGEDAGSGPAEVALMSNPKKPLCPVFWGFIDKVDFVGNQRGVQIVLTGRDRLRVLQDTKIIAITSFTGEQFKNQGADIEQVGNGFRANILLDVANAAVGNANLPNSRVTDADGNSQPGPEDEANKCWKPVLGADQGGLLYAARTKLVDGAWPVQQQPPKDIPAWVLRGAFMPMDAQARPRFHRWVERPPLIKNNEASVFELYNQTPMECINFLAKTEERPIDVFSSHVNGDFMFVPRIMDMSGLEDPNRFYRTYFFRGFPDKSCPPHPGQMIQSLRTVSTSLGTFNRFVVVNGGTNSNTTTLANLSAAISYLPLPLQERKPLPPCRTQIISDDSADLYGNAQVGALIVAMSVARTHGRDLSLCQMTVLGDPTFFPGEAVKVWGTVLHDQYASTPLADEDAYTQGEKAKHGAFQSAIGNAPSEPSICDPIEQEVRSGENLVRDVLANSNVTQPIRGLLEESLKRTLNAQEQATVDSFLAGYTQGAAGRPGASAPELSVIAAGGITPGTSEVVRCAMELGRTDSQGGTDISKSLLPVYKVRTVKHTLTSTGINAIFTTEVAMAADY